VPGEGGDVRLLEVRSSFLLNARDLTMDCKGDGVDSTFGWRTVRVNDGGVRC
jgi:hypothetical protein